MILVATSMVLKEETRKLLQQVILTAIPNGVVISHVLGWLDAADDSLHKVDLVRLMKRSFTDIDISDAKEMLKNIVKENIDSMKNDKDVEKLMKGHRHPEKKEKDIEDIIDLNAKLDGLNLLPTFLLVSSDMKRIPELQNPEDNIENVSHKVKMLESCIVNLADKVTEGQRALKEEIRGLKPSFADVLKNRERGNPPKRGDNDANTNDARERKRSRVEEERATHGDNQNHAHPEDVFDHGDGYEHQNRRGFAGAGNRNNQD